MPRSSSAWPWPSACSKNPGITTSRANWGAGSIAVGDIAAVDAAALLRDPERQNRLRGAMAERLKVEEGKLLAVEIQAHRRARIERRRQGGDDRRHRARRAP